MVYKVLKRNRNRLSLLFSGLYISLSLAFIINVIYIPLRTNPLVYILHLLSVYLVIFGFIFLILFNINLLNIYTDFSLKKQSFIVLLYAITIFFLIQYPGGITINEQTNWKPVWSWDFLIILYIYVTAFIIAPTIILSLKIYKKFQDKDLRKKWKLYFTGICCLSISFYFAGLYNTWNNPTYRSIYSVLSLIEILAGVLIYYGFGHKIPSSVPDKKCSLSSLRLIDLTEKKLEEFPKFFKKI